MDTSELVCELFGSWSSSPDSSNVDEEPEAEPKLPWVDFFMREGLDARMAQSMYEVLSEDLNMQKKQSTKNIK